ncbi:ribokinase [Lentibacillus cibarius]|uniref:Ribokinase n=1 Tax=Lentibacillus cibarius TaxID=2583219 RepID=A0A549YEV8_9BACI|nr:ribokinase [Lentibacillus cibarius]TMN21506.1 ribokinase [Lentibacillus cibarius]TRM10405.1 ribokinase [Lentibacillus cibarius]
MNAEPNVCIVGSINMDLTVTTDKIPQQGETVMGSEFFANPGGKGANQAVAAARMGANVHFIGAVGDDAFGEKLLTNFANEGIQTGGVETIPETATGTATIILSDNDNRIIVAPGANHCATPELAERHRSKITGSDVVLLQLEVPMETIVYTVQAAAESGVPVILNPAPYQSLPDSVLQGVHWMTPNELEAKGFAEDPLYDMIQEKLIITRGDKGASFTINGQERHVPGYGIFVMDTTGAGDTFNGALTAEIARGTAMDEAVRMANAAAALSVTKVGAQGGMPTKQEVEAFLQERKASK